MAVLGEIRKKTWLVFVVIGLAMLAFVAGDLFGENSRIKQLFTGDPSVVGKVNGEPIGIAEYQSAYDATQKMYENQGQSATPNQIAQQTWNSLVSQKVLKQHAEKLGLKVADDEFWNYVAQNFGMSSGAEAQQQIAQLEASAATNPEAQQQFRGWLQTSEQIKLQLLSQKYFSYVMAGTAVTNKEADIQQAFNISNANIQYAFVDYASLAKKLNVKVTDDEISAYEAKFPKLFKAEGLVKLSYTYFPAGASAADQAVADANIRKYLSTQIIHDDVNNVTDTIQAFGATKNDSIYVTQNSEKPFISNYFTKSELEQAQLGPEATNFLKTAAIGQVGGPFKIGNTYQLYKLSKAKEVKDSVKSSHILITFQGSNASNPVKRTKEEAKKLAEQILAQVKSNPSSFGELASTKSDDKSSAVKNGSIGWVGKNNQLDQTYNGFIFSKPVGTVDMVESQFGYHIIKVEDAKNKTAYQVANIVKTIEPSKETTEKAFTNARTYVQNVENKSLNDFKNIAKKSGYLNNTTEGIERYASIGQDIPNDQDADILKWAFDKKSEVGATNLFTSTTGDYIVVHLVEKFDKGLANPSVVRQYVEPVLMHEKVAKLVDEQVANGGLNAFVSKYGAKKGNATVNFSNSNLDGVGLEPKVVGAAFGVKVNQSSKAIAGNAGIFYIIPVAQQIEKNQKGTMILENLNRQLQGEFQQTLLQSLIQAADVVDNRGRALR
ncbi:peptidylprolyl isomerase [Chishuiella sp.]|uniref:peptidylprolyl isomerase n=1 Tax=Chishuiella sp. TaxID=1969467 RepID=UPI0028AAFA50|nr:peptidylprolyl isomerase [Chishuiella sp.]